MKGVLRVVLATVACSCASAPVAHHEFLLIPGRNPPRDAELSGTAIVHKGRTMCSVDVTYQGHEFNIERKCGQSTILYVQTFDTSFVTPDGVSVGDSMAKAIAAGGTSQDEGCTVSLPSGWRARAERKSDEPRCQTTVWYLDRH